MILGKFEARLVVMRLPCIGPVMMSMMVGPGVLVHNSRLGIEMVRATFSAVRTGELVIGAGGGGLMGVPVLTTIGWMEALSAQLLALTVNMKESFPVKLRLGT